MPLNAARLQRVQDILEETRTKSSTERVAFVAKACGDDAEVREEVESLLEHADQAGEDFLKVPEPGFRLGLQGIPADGPDPLLDTHIGSYHIRSVIATGGMGTVYLAEQDKPRREVALKVMTAGAFTTRSALRRFEYESQILAKLRHPNIAHVYEAGTHQLTQSRDNPGAGPVVSVLYFAMEYIAEALPITRYASEHRLALRERLNLFLRVCNAVHHGHQKGVIHRDLKPGNILVDSAGEPKVIDFGVAKSTDSDVAVTALRTDVGQIIGTLQYMSPEQCAADPYEIDTRSDVYSLGVVLYELLTERLPYDVSNMTLQSAARRICEQAPAHPSTFIQRLHGDLETIILKTLEKQREKRYQSAAELAADIQRYQSGEPISARPPNLWTRAMRWVTRHPVKMTAATCLLFAAATFAATKGSVWWYNERPYRIRIEEARCARLVSFSDRTLQTWPEEPQPNDNEHRLGNEGALLVNRAKDFGGGRLAIVAYTPVARNQFPGEVCAYDLAGSMTAPIWHDGITNKDLPKNLQEAKSPASRCIPHHLMTADIFPEPNGGERQDEIVVIFGNGGSSQEAIRIYDITGKLLYQVWQDGTTQTARWMAESGLLVLDGLDERVKAWAQHSLTVRSPRAPVVFALRPVREFITNEYLESIPHDRSGAPQWYKWLHPMESQELEYDLSVSRPAPGSSHPEAAAIDIMFESHPRASVSFLISAEGTEVEGSRVPTDEYNRLVNLGILPRPSELFLSLDPPTAAWTHSRNRGD